MTLEAGAGQEGSGPRLAHVPALDGLRALAVLSVMAYHGGFSWIPGGFHGVDAFFVLSGYLITSLLIVERRGTGTIRFRRFWARRARRLLPALFVLVGGLAILHRAWPGALPWTNPLPDVAATLGYVANWHFVAGNADYFAPSFPSPLLHTWSLAIEEQFYVLWPLVVFAVLGRVEPVRATEAGGARLPTPPGLAGSLLRGRGGRVGRLDVDSDAGRRQPRPGLLRHRHAGPGPPGGGGPGGGAGAVPGVIGPGPPVGGRGRGGRARGGGRRLVPRPRDVVPGLPRRVPVGLGGLGRRGGRRGPGPGRSRGAAAVASSPALCGHDFLRGLPVVLAGGPGDDTATDTAR